jgi:Holliday junction resolvase
MSASQRTKGAAGEREVFALLRDRLGDDDIQRNPHQSRAGGMDCAKLVGGMALEVKRWRATADYRRALEQARHQAEAAKGVPCVAYRFDRGEWRFLVDLTLEQFCQLAREGTCEDMT